LAVFALLASVSGAASAQSIEIERLQLDPSARGSLVLGSGEVAEQGSFRLSFAGHWEHRPLVLVDGFDVLGRRSDDAAVALIEDRLSVLGTVSFVILPRVEIYARGTFVADQDGESGLAPADSSGFGMPSFGLRLAGLQQVDGAPVNVALAAEFMPAWGTPDAAAKFSDPSALIRLEVGRWHGPVLFAANAGLLARPTIDVGTREHGSEAQFGAVVALKGGVSPELSYRAAIDMGDGLPSQELLAGIRARLGFAELFALGGPGFSNRAGTPQWRALAGLALGYDRPREVKRAEPAPAPAPAPVKEKPAKAAPPPPPPPDPCAQGQKHTPEQCPDLDDDRDGVANRDDRCPLEKGAADNQGCPRVVVQPEAKKVELREKVQFETGKATIRPESDSLLEEVAETLKAHPEIKKVVIEGHSDSTGGAALNRRLSQARADAVSKALVSRGVEASRLSAKGFGPSRPVASNDTAEGREANRRVEISIAQSE
jgi:outer membrane protein OmpA-like peptidoglycan-associated protein